MLGEVPIPGFEMLGELTAAVANFEGENYSRIIFTMDAAIEDPHAFKLIAGLKEELAQFYPAENIHIAGESVAAYDMSVAFPADNLKVTLFTLAFILLILLITFKNLGLPPLLMIAIQGGIWINFALPFLMDNPVSFVGYLLISAIQMGATIDYAIVLTNRFNTTKQNYLDKKTAMAEAVNAVFPTIITSGTILTLTGFALGIMSTGIVQQLGTLLGIGALASVLIVIFVLPSLLLISDKLTQKLQLRLPKKLKEKLKKT
jgi:predicted RND superfamily exporter protein